jgi:hypothetical protein
LPDLCEEDAYQVLIFDAMYVQRIGSAPPIPASQERFCKVIRDSQLGSLRFSFVVAVQRRWTRALQLY